MTPEKLELLPGRQPKPQPLFANDEAYQAFRASFQEQIKEDLDRYRKARLLSEEKAKRHFVY